MIPLLGVGSVILASCEVEIGRIATWGKPGQKVRENPISTSES
jgi:hypothetical protein